MLLLVTLVSLGSASDAPSSAVDPPAGGRHAFVVAGYAPDYRLQSLNLQAVGDSLSHVLLFSISPHANGSLSTDRLPPIHMMQVGRAKKKHSHLRVLVSVGGGGRSEHFAAMAGNKASRARFAKHLTRYVVRNHLDGADLDWEAPTNEAEASTYSKVLARLRKSFGSVSPPLELTMAMHTGGHVSLLQPAVAHVDRVHLMAYDIPDEHGQHSSELATADVVAEAISAGIPREKLVLGIPLYGRHTEQLSRAEPYSLLRRRRGPADPEDYAGRFYFNGPGTVARKTALAASEGLAGVMVWELGQDDDAASTTADARPLLPVIASVAHRAVAAGWQAGKRATTPIEATADLAAAKDEL